MRIISGLARGTKLYTLPGDITRPTLDRIKESVFNILQPNILDSKILDLFAGSGAIGLEFLSRGAKECIFCDSSKDAIEIIKKNIQKTHFADKSKTYNISFEKLTKKLSSKIFDIIYLDPPYKTNYIEKALGQVVSENLIDQNSIIVIETDNVKKINNYLEQINLKIIDQRKYGIVNIIFVKKI